MRIRQRAALVLVTSAVALSAGCVSSTRPTDRAATFDEAVAAAKAKDFRRAFEKARSTIERRSTFAPAYQLLADAAFMMGQPQAAIDSFAELAQRDAATVHARWGLGLSYRRLGRYQDARAPLEQALDRDPGNLRVLHELLIVARAQRDLDRVYDTLDERRRHPGAPFAALTYAMAEAREMAYLLDDAEVLIRESLARQPLPETFALFARIRNEQVRFNDCIKLATEGIDLARQIEGRGSSIEASMRLSRADSLRGVDQPEASEAERLQALEIFRAVGDLSGEADARRALSISANHAGKDHASLEFVREAIAVHETLGEKPSLARDLQMLVYPAGRLVPGTDLVDGLERAVQLTRDAGDERTESRIVGTLGATLLVLGRYGEAMPHLLQALDVTRRLGARRAEAVNTANLAELFAAIGDWPRAHEYGSRALLLYQQAGSRTDMVLTLQGLGNVCFERRELACAGDYHRRVVDLGRPFQDGPYADGLVNLARDEQAAGRLDEARRLLAEARDIHHRRGDQQRPMLAIASGELELAAGRHQQAGRHFEDALRMVFAEHNEPAVAVQAHRGLADSATARGNLSQALDHYRRAIGWIETLRRDVKLSSLRSSYFRHQRDMYVEAVGVLFDLHRTDSDGGRLREAFEIAEKAHARTLLDSLGPLDSDHDLLLDERRRTQQRISRIQSRLFYDSISPPERARLQEALSSEERHFADLDLEAVKVRPARATHREAALSPLDAARAIVRPGNTLLEFLVGDTRSFLFIVSHDGNPVIHQLPGRQVIEAKVRKFRDLLATRPAAGEAPTHIRRLGADLFDTLLPVTLPTPVTQLLIVPDGMLFYLPFETLAEAPAAPYLAERFAISYAASAATLATIERRGSLPAARAIVAFGDPKPTPAATTSAGAGDAVLRALTLDGFRFSALPNSRREVEAIARLFGPSATVHTGDEFREETVLSELAQPKRYVHFATHAAIDETVPARSGIIVTRPRGSAMGDGIIQAREIAGLRIAADLVTLSACQTGLGQVVGGEGVLGLARAFQEAGALSLVVSLWNVSDASTATLMTEFYRALTAGTSKTAALQAARLAMLRNANPALRHPYYWAPFVLLGAP